MRLIVNGEPCEMAAETTLDTLLRALNMPPERVATLVNDHVVRKESRLATSLKEGDRVEAFTFACGG